MGFGTKMVTSFANMRYCCVSEILSKILLSTEVYYPPVIPAEAGIQASLNWTPAPIYTGAGSARE